MGCLRQKARSGEGQARRSRGPRAPGAGASRAAAGRSAIGRLRSASHERSVVDQIVLRSTTWSPAAPSSRTRREALPVRRPPPGNLPWPYSDSGPTLAPRARAPWTCTGPGGAPLPWVQPATGYASTSPPTSGANRLERRVQRKTGDALAAVLLVDDEASDPPQVRVLFGRVEKANQLGAGSVLAPAYGLIVRIHENAVCLSVLNQLRSQ